MLSSTSSLKECGHQAFFFEKSQKMVNWKYGITIFKDWRSAIKNHLVRNLPLQRNHTPKLVIAIKVILEIVRW
jgi:hypothetical protein